MDKSYYIYCNGNHCLLKSNCKRYLYGLRFPVCVQKESDQYMWIDNCDAETRELFEPEKKSE